MSMICQHCEATAPAGRVMCPSCRRRMQSAPAAEPVLVGAHASPSPAAAVPQQAPAFVKDPWKVVNTETARPWDPAAVVATQDVVVAMDPAQAAAAGIRIGNRGGIARVMLGVAAAANVVLMVAIVGRISVITDIVAYRDHGTGNPDDILSRVHSSDNFCQTASWVMLCTYLAAAVALMLWHRSVDEAARQSGLAPAVSRGWVTWGWIVPIASLFMPFRSLTDLSVRLRQRRGMGLMQAWWFSFIAASIVGRIAYSSSGNAHSLSGVKGASYTVIVMGVIAIVAAVLAVMVVTGLTQATRDRLALASAPAGPEA